MHDIRQNPNPEPRPEPQLKPDVGPAGSGKAADAAAGANTPVPRQAQAQPATPQPPVQAPASAQPPARPAASGLSGGWDNDGPETRPMSPGVSYEVTGTAPTAPPSPSPTPAPVGGVPPTPVTPPPPAPEPVPVAPVQPAAPTAQTRAPADAASAVSPHEHRALAKSLKAIKRGLVSLIGLLAFTAIYFVAQSTIHPKTPQAGTGSNQNSSQSTGSGQGAANTSNNTDRSNQTRAVSCLGQTGADATTDSKSFTDVEGSECTYRSGANRETLVLNGKLTGRNTEGTGMSVTINVNGKVCNGGESLNYSRTYTPMVSNCVFEVPPNSSVAIKWQFLSPFGGSASILRSSNNIAPSITGVAIPKLE